MADRFPLVANSSTNQIQEIPSGDNLNLDSNGIVNVGVITASGFSGPVVAGAGTSNIVSGIATYTQVRVGGDTTHSEDLVVTGNARVTGILTVGTGSLTITDRDINAAGVTTASNFKTGSTNVHSVGVEAAGINVLGGDTPIGAGSTIYNSGAAIFTGIITAPSAVFTGNTQVQTIDTGSNGHVKVITEGGERLRISNGGQIGLSGANYGSSGQVLTSQGSGSAAAWTTVIGVPSGIIAVWSGSEGSIPSGWYLCNGSNGTPDLRNRFIVGAGSGSSYSVGNTGGSNTVTLSTSQIPAHSHTTNNHSHNASVSDPGHGHSVSVSDPGHSHNTSVTGAKLFPGYGGAHVPYGGAGGYPGTHFNMSNANTGISANASNANTSISVSTGNANPSTNNTGGGGSHENRPPYYALCYIMKS